jgi:HSP20 family protein
MAEQQNQQKEFFTEIKNEFKEIGSKVNKMFDDLVRGKDGGKTYIPATDIWETKEEMVFELDLPGCSKSDFNVQIRDNALVIKGSRNRAADPTTTHMQRERGFGEFERTFPLPGNIDQNRIKAKYDVGVLRVTLAKEAVEIEATNVAVE